MNYKNFLKNKDIKVNNSDLEILRNDLNNKLFEYQKDLVNWSLKLGKSALFTDTGTGKTIMQLEFAEKVYQKTNKNCLIVCPLGVTYQTVEEAKEKLDINVNILRNNPFKKGINIINYEMLDKVNYVDYDCVILDESSILKNYSGKLRQKIINSFHNYTYKLACTATPSPNDFMELGNHSEFLNNMKRVEMLSMYFVHDSGNTSQWRLKKHSIYDFWKWVSSWGAIMHNPADLGYNDKRFNLPKLNYNEIIVNSNKKFNAGFFAISANTLSERREARKITLDQKVDVLSNIVNNSNDIHLIWCDLNIESEKAKKNIKDTIEIKGSHSFQYKEEMMLKFAKGQIKCLVTKPSICGFGMNWQICNNMSFLGLSDSFEKFYQAIRRCWRFGQEKDVNVNILSSNLEKNILQNIKRKESDFSYMYEIMKKNTKNYLYQNIIDNNNDIPIKKKKKINIPDFLGE
jgi:superfamily II DNA or RNA helicase